MAGSTMQLIQLQHGEHVRGRVCFPLSAMLQSARKTLNGGLCSGPEKLDT